MEHGLEVKLQLKVVVHDASPSLWHDLRPTANNMTGSHSSFPLTHALNLRVFA